MTLNCAIIDDEPLAVALLVSYVKKTPFLNLVGAYNSAVQAIKDISENDIQLVFMDIQMPELSGIEFAKILPKDTKIIFTTAYNQYAIESYQVNAIDYLLKPISYENFLNASNKALDWFNTTFKSFREDRFLYIKSEYKLVQIRFEDILYIEGVKDYVKIHRDKGLKTVMSLMNMKRLEDALPRPEFMRVHKSYIVHMPKIELIDRFRLVFGKVFIPISESYRISVQQYLDTHSVSREDKRAYH